LLYIISLNALISTSINFLGKYNLNISLVYTLTSPTINSLNKYNLDKGLVYLGYKASMANIELTNKINLNRPNIPFNPILNIKKLKNINK
jgi:uncharacterized protein with von Willebrand factor type A (vWA) domain